MKTINQQITEQYKIIADLTEQVDHYGMKGDTLNNGLPNTKYLEFKKQLELATQQLHGLLHANSYIREHGGMPSMVDG